MKLKNKKTGEVVDIEGADAYQGQIHLWDRTNHKSHYFNSLAELSAEWEDYEEPKEYYVIERADKGGLFVRTIPSMTMNQDWIEEDEKAGIKFETLEEAEKAVEKLKAWKRLKDEEFTISGWSHTPDMNLTTGSFITIKGFIPRVVKNMKDLDLLFGGEDE